MRVFISWSGERSRLVGSALRDWLQDVLQFVEPWMSSADINAGQRWSLEIGRVLEECKFGILCVTPENVSAPWLLFEAGALSKFVDDSAVIPLLYQVSFSDINNGPLGQFQAKKLDKDGVFELLTSMNACGGEALEEHRLRRLFERSWPDLERAISTIPPDDAPRESKRSTDDILEELVIGVRRIETRLALVEDEMADPDPAWIGEGGNEARMIAVLREAALRAMHETSLRSVARDIGMSPMGLQHFVSGTRPYRSTLQKIKRWYVHSLFEPKRTRPSGWDLVAAEPKPDESFEDEDLQADNREHLERE